MAVYVDTVREYPDAGLRFREFCHLLADSRDELHEFADRLGIPRRFFQDHPWRWHHDLPAHVREQAVALGARQITMHEVGALLRRRRAEYRAAAATTATTATTATAATTAPTAPTATTPDRPVGPIP